MKKWVLSLCALLATATGIVAIPVLQQVQVKQALYAQSGESQIYRDHKTVLDQLDVVATDGVGYDGRLLEFGKLADAVNGKYTMEEMVKLSKHENPVTAMMGMELIARQGGADFLVRFLSDRRKVRYRSGCTVNVMKPIGAVLGEEWGLEGFKEDHRLQLAWLGVVVWTWE